MRHNRLRRWAVLPVAASLAFVGVRAVAEDAPEVTRLIKGGRYREAYEAAVRGGEPDAAALGDMARTLLGTSMNSDNSYERWFALQAAQPLIDRQLLDSVRVRARVDDRYERSLALEILVRTDPQGSREELLAGLASPYRVVRLRALNGLAKLNDRTLTERFGTVLHSDPDPDLRAVAARALSTTGASEALPMLHQALSDPMAVVQEEALRSLVALHDPGITDIMRRRLADNPTEQRVRTLRMAGLVPDRALIRALAPYLGDADPEARAFAAAAILSILEHTAAGNP